MATKAAALAVASFDEFARLVHAPEDESWRPYPWQTKFAERCAAPGGAPPAWVVAPTGAGKTIAVDALVWALAMQADVPAAERTASTRIVWAIDRRILVDQVHEHAEALAARLEGALENGSDDPLHGIALRLLQCAAGEDASEIDEEERGRIGLRPLVATRWRGGIPHDGSLHSPLQPQVITSTVGQIGSRLLFRGYGVGRGSLPLSAGLAATDTTICLDEAHLAAPFRETVDAIRRRRRGDPLRTPPLHLVTLTATPPEKYERDDSVSAEEEDWRRLGARWAGVKTAELRDPGGKAGQELASAALELLRGGSRVVACIANRVLTARQVHDELRERLGEEVEVLLLIGPQRPADRAGQLERARGPLLEGQAPEKPLIVVATQTIEVGLDADFDGMVTQSASASALVQRLGRLNRSGGRPGRCIVVRDPDFPLYAQDEPEAWRWLGERRGAPADIDVSVRAIAESDPRPPPDRNPPLAATLTDAIVAQLAQTSSRPAQLADPDLDPLLSGIGARSLGDVRIVWRCDLLFASREGEEEPAGANDYRRALLELVPPRPWEALTLSVSAARSLLRNLIAGPGRPGPSARGDADVEGGGRMPDETFAADERAPFMVVRGDEVLAGAPRSDADEKGGVKLAEIAPGDTLVIPSGLGGVDDFGLAASRRGEARDVHPDMAPAGKGLPPDEDRSPIRLSWETFWEKARGSRTRGPDAFASRQAEGTARGEWEHFVSRLAETVQGEGGRAPVSSGALAADEMAALLRAALSRSAKRLTEIDRIVNRVATSGHPWRLRRIDPPQPPETERSVGGDSELRRSAWVLQPLRPRREDETSERSTPPTLEEHSEAVRRRVAGYAGRLGLEAPERCALELAALAHDLGKLDPRFQDFLAGGSRNLDMPYLAKSTFGDRNPAAARLAHRESGLPLHFRHEARSAAILDAALAEGAIPSELSAAYGPLGTFLTGAHHCYGLPLWPLERGGSPAEAFAVDLLGIRGSANGANADGWLDGRWMQLFSDLQERYGPWTLAYLEALLAIADRTISSEGG